MSLSQPLAEEGVSEQDFHEVIASFGFTIQPKDEADYIELLRAGAAAIDTVNKLPEYRDPRLMWDDENNSARSYTKPKSSENPLNAWSHRTTIPPTAQGLLSGKTIAIKDNICVAGLPLTAGTHPYHLSKSSPYPISPFDAPVVTRVLEAGATITGISTCENYCMSALSSMSATGPVDNPWLPGHAAGGSSSGSAALIALKQVYRARPTSTSTTNPPALGEGADLALGADQGGSIRLPAAFSGIYGLKPTHGLVPYTGLTPLHPAIDHCGPMAGSLRDTALLLTVLAGYDGLDPRMTPETPLRGAVPAYHERLDAAIAARQAAGDWTLTTAARGLRIGVIAESFSAPFLSDDVAAVVRAAAQRFAALGAAVVEDVSIPMHGAVGGAIFHAVTGPDMANVFLHGKPPELLSWPLAHLAATARAPDAGWYERMNAGAPTVVNRLFSGRFFDAHAADGRFPLVGRARAVTQALALRAAYDDALARYDVLLTPANPTVAPRHLRAEEGVLAKQHKSLDITWNTCPFNLTGHPGLVIPAGWGKAEEGEGKLPIGMQLVGRRWGEEALFFAAAAWELGGLGLAG